MKLVLLIFVFLTGMSSAHAYEQCPNNILRPATLVRGSDFGDAASEALLRIKAGASTSICKIGSGLAVISVFPVIGKPGKNTQVVELFLN